MKKALVALAAVLALAGCGKEHPYRDPTPSVTFEETPRGFQHWKEMSEDDQADVCAAASGPLPGEAEVGGHSATPGGNTDIDYKGMMDAIEKVGYSQPEAAAMLPYALEECR